MAYKDSKWYTVFKEYGGADGLTNPCADKNCAFCLYFGILAWTPFIFN